MNHTISPREFSIELFPPKDAKAEARLENTLVELSALGPDFFSVTFGAGGTTRSGTLKTAITTRNITGRPAVPHLSCIESTHDSICALLDSYAAAGIDRIVALRGDLPEGMSRPGTFNHANELVEFIRQRHGDDFRLEVAAYPEFHPAASCASADVDNFVRKVRAGANAAITQYFYNADAYFNFREEVASRGVDIPIVPGIMPIDNFAQVARFSAVCGAGIPRWVQLKMESYGDDIRSVRDFGHDLVAGLCNRLLDGGAPGLHFYSLNKSRPTCRLWHDLNLPVPESSHSPDKYTRVG